jgi:murein DD-endopeptidase MepM/ murein hydrolase activator NlpD
VRLRRIVGAVLVVGLVAAPALAQVTDDDLTAAELEIATTRAELEALAVELEAATVRSIELEVELDRLNRSVLETQVQVAAALGRLQERAVALYTASTSNRVSLLFFSGTPEQLGAGISYLESLAIDDEMIINDLEGLRAEYERQQSVLADLEAEQEATLVRLDATAAQLNERLGGAQSAYVALVDRKLAEEEEARRIEEERRLAEEAARAATSTTTTSTTTTTTTVTTTTTTIVEETTTTTTAETTTTLESTTTTTTIPSSAGMACPINGFTTFTDTWGAPRSGGRTHQGVDMLAARGTATVAIESGTIRRLGSGGLGGITIWLTGQSGDEYYYAHLDGWAPGLSVGRAVGVGELIGFVGSTGNASYSVPHLHFELHPGGGSAVNPYPLVKGLCG